MKKETKHLAFATRKLLEKISKELNLLHLVKRSSTKIA